MRLIDADELIEILADMQGRCNTKAALIHNSKIWKLVKTMPTVEAIPVEWIKQYGEQNWFDYGTHHNAITCMLKAWEERKG